MKAASIFFSLLLAFCFAQNTSCSCCTAPYQQFDFWIGEWTVYDTTGKQVGTNRINRLHDSCIIQENYQTKTGYTGTSYNFYNAADSSWNQTWVDNKGGSLVLKGRFDDGKMVLRSKLLPGQLIPFYRHRIIWYTTEKGSVMQVWHILNEADSVLQLIFKGEYRKKADYAERKAEKLATKSPFEKIVDRELPATIEYEDDEIIAFIPLRTQAPVHILIVPKKRIPTLNDLSEEDAAIVGRMFLIAKKLAKEKGIDESGYRTVFNNNEDSGQSVFHIHLHLIGGKLLGPMVTQDYR